MWVAQQGHGRIPFSVCSVIVNDLNRHRLADGPAETDALLIVDANTHLTFPAAFQRLQPVARRLREIVKGQGGIQLAQLAKRPILHVRWKRPAAKTLPDAFCLLATERSNHEFCTTLNDTRYVSDIIGIVKGWNINHCHDSGVVTLTNSNTSSPPARAPVPPPT
jgi:hypothetical protein